MDLKKYKNFHDLILDFVKNEKIDPKKINLLEKELFDKFINFINSNSKKDFVNNQVYDEDDLYKLIIKIIMYSIEFETEEISEMLVRKFHEDEILEQTRKNNLDLVIIFFKVGKKKIIDEVLIEACRWGHLEIVKYIVENGVKTALAPRDRRSHIHFSNENPLRASCLNMRLEIVKYLVEKGANIHCENDSLIRRICRDWCCLTEITKYLIEKGANIHANEDECFISCVENGNIKTLEYLIERKNNDKDYSKLLEECSKMREKKSKFFSMI